MEITRVAGGLHEVVGDTLSELDKPFTVPEALARNVLLDGSNRFEPADKAAEAVLDDLKTKAAAAKAVA